MENDLDPALSAETSTTDASMSAAPGVVAVVVVHLPNPDLSEVLSKLQAQDYPNMQVLILVNGFGADDLALVNEIVQVLAPGAYVRSLGADVGFGSAANSVLRLVDGDSGFFLMMHDDVALAPDAVRNMVEELCRSNAGLVGPKFYRWPRVASVDSSADHDAEAVTDIQAQERVQANIQMVGFDCDWFGELDSPVEPDEIDQEQHDAVRDVFMLSSACLLIRADLFREMGGFEPSIDFYGEDLDLCWRAHLSGARVIIVPAAMARHRGEFDARLDYSRTTELSQDIDRQRTRLMTVAALTSGRRTAFILPLMVLLTLGSSIGALWRSRGRSAVAGVAAILGAVLRGPSIVARRRRVKVLRRVPNHEVVELQLRGSARWKRLVRQRRISPAVIGHTLENDRSNYSKWSLVVWGGLALVLLVGGRQLWTNGVQSIGEFLPLPGSPRDVLHGYLNGWSGQELGSTSAQPTSTALVGLAGLLSFGQMGLLHTLITIGLIPMGWWGASALCSVVATERARLAGVIAYAAVPLPYAAVASGRHQVLIAYAVIPWSLHLLRSFSGIGRSIVDDEPGDVVAHPSSSQRIRLAAKLSLLFAVTMAFSPAVVLVVLLCALLWLLTAFVSGGSTRAAGLGFAGGLVAGTAAIVLNLPWMTRYLADGGWNAIVGVNTAEPENLGWWSLLRFAIGPAALGGLIVLLYIPLLVAPFVSKNSRFVWASRAAILAVGSVVLAKMNSGQRLPFRLPETGILLAPAASGLAIAAAIIVMSFGIDVRGGKFGWRQPLALLSLVTLMLGLFPLLATAPNGRWNQPSIAMNEQMQELLSDKSSGDFRVLVVGDPRLVTSGQHEYGDGLAFSLMQVSQHTMLEQFSSASSDVDELVRPLIVALAQGSTKRVGRLMAPLGIRYVVIPIFDRVNSTSNDPLAIPDGLTESLAEQLDLRQVYSPASMVIFENSQWIPITAMLSVAAQQQSGAGGAAALVTMDLSGSVTALAGSTSWAYPSENLASGIFHLGLPFDSRWKLVIEGTVIEPNASFGTVMNFATGDGGVARLEYQTPVSRYFWVILQALLWLIVVLGIFQPRRRRSTPVIDSAPVIELLGGGM